MGAWTDSELATSKRIGVYRGEVVILFRSYRQYVLPVRAVVTKVGSHYIYCEDIGGRKYKGHPVTRRVLIKGSDWGKAETRE